MNNYASYIDISKEVLKALQFDIPIVAFPTSLCYELQTINQIENTVRENKAVPAFIAIIDGRIKIGLNKNEFDFIWNTKNLMKIDRKDVPYAIALEKSGRVSLSAAMIFSEIAGIKVIVIDKIFSCNQESYLDCLADIAEFEKTNVCVICSDQEFTTEMDIILRGMNATGIPILSFNSTSFLETSKPCECAAIIKTKWDLDLTGGILIINDSNIDSSSIKSLEHNAELAARIAVEYDKIKEC